MHRARHVCGSLVDSKPASATQVRRRWDQSYRGGRGWCVAVAVCHSAQHVGKPVLKAGLGPIGTGHRTSGQVGWRSARRPGRPQK